MNTYPTRLLTLLASAVLLAAPARAQVPQLINYQGRVVVGTVNFNGTGQFKFALVNAAGTTTYWSNDGASVAGAEPAAAVPLAVTKGLYSVLLGDATLPSMTIVPATVFTNPDVRLRVWFNDGVNGSQLLTPDQRIAAVGYAMMAGNVQDGTITSAKIASGGVGSAQLAPNLTLTGTTTGTFAGGGTTAFQTIAGTSQNAVANTNYLLTNAALSTVTLPSAPTVGDVVRINGVGTGGWQAAPNSGQSIVGAGTSVGPAGVTWTARDSVRIWRAVASSADGSKLVATDGGNGSGGQLYTSTDSGVTWTARESNRDWLGVASSTDGTKLVAAANGGQLYTSTDSGVTWTAREGNRNWLGVASSADGTKLVAGVVAGQLYTTTDSGATWTARESNRNWISVASSADGTKLIVGVDSGQLYTSTDSGATWTARFIQRSWQAVASSADGTKLVAGNLGGQLYTSTDSGVTWTARESNRNWIRVASSADGTKLIASVAFGDQLYTSTDSGVTWTARESNRNWGGVASSADGTKLIAGVAGGQLYTSTGSSISNPLAGVAGTTVGLQYIGNNQWQALTEAAAASANSVAAANITGTIAGPQITSGAIGSTQLASNLTLGGTTTGTFSGGLTGNVTGNVTGSAVSFSGVLAGDVLGPQSATVVSTVGSSTAANIHTAELTTNAATNANTPSTIVRRDASGNFSAGTITATLAAGSVGTAQLAANAVQTVNIADGQVTAAKLAASAGATPAGGVIAFAGSAAPAGWLLCNGAAVSRTGVNAALYAAISTAHGIGDGSTTFNVPDYRGRFLRGVDGGALNDPDSSASANSGVDGKRYPMATGGNTGNAVGSVQGDALQGHRHTFAESGGAGGQISAVQVTTAVAGNGVQWDNKVLSPVSDGVHGVPRTSSETRSLNAYVNYIIKQ